MLQNGKLTQKICARNGVSTVTSVRTAVEETVNPGCMTLVRVPKTGILESNSQGYAQDQSGARTQLGTGAAAFHVTYLDENLRV